MNCRRTLGAFAIGAMAIGLTTCKPNLSPSSLAKTFTAIKDARKDLTPENEYYVGRAVATNLLAKYDYKYLDKSALAAGKLEGLTAYVGRVGNAIAFAAMQDERSGDRPSPIAGWHFTIVDDDSINAFAAPGGYIFITMGALTAAESEDQLAAVLAHEVAHVVRGHALGSIKKSRWAGVAKETLDSSVQLDNKALGDLTKVFEGAMDDIVDAVLVKGYSRDTEFEADRIGAQIMADAGYDPAEFTRYLERLKKQQKTGDGGFTATHPSASDRIEKVNGHVQGLEGGPLVEERTKRFRDALAAG